MKKWRERDSPLSFSRGELSLIFNLYLSLGIIHSLIHSFMHANEYKSAYFKIILNK